MAQKLEKPHPTINRILFVSGREVDYTRNDVIIRALSQIGNVDVVGGNGRGSIVWRSIGFTIKALWLYITRHYDVIVVGFYGHLLMLPLGFLTRRPILFDAFLSTYDTLCDDRRRYSGDSLVGKLAFWLDKTASHFSSAVLLDTPLHARYFIETFDLPAEKVFSLPVGCNEQIFYPQQVPRKIKNITTVLFYGTYLPLHGTDVIVNAAARLSYESIRFKLIGNGPMYADTIQLAQSLQLETIDFLPPTSLEELATHIATADICLGGHFGTSLKAARVVPGKIYQILAMARPVVAASSPANMAFLTHNHTAMLCPANNPDALAEAILTLHQNPTARDNIAAAGHKLFQAMFSETTITAELQEILSHITQL